MKISKKHFKLLHIQQYFNFKNIEKFSTHIYYSYHTSLINFNHQQWDEAKEARKKKALQDSSTKQHNAVDQKVPTTQAKKTNSTGPLEKKKSLHKWTHSECGTTSRRKTEDTLLS